jgi:hypothetical protein
MSGKWLVVAGMAILGTGVPAEAQYYPPPQQYPPQQYPPQQYPPQQYPQQQYPQQYPQQQYPQQYPPQQQYYPPQQPGGLAGGFINSVTGYGRYPYGNYGYEQYGNERYGIDRCARAIEQRLNGYAYNWYGNGGGNYQYRRYRPSGRVEGITRVERKSYGLKVWGVASSGYGGYEGWNRPGYGTYGYNAGADLSFECKVYPSGQIRDIDIKRRSANWRGY